MSLKKKKDKDLLSIKTGERAKIGQITNSRKIILIRKKQALTKNVLAYQKVKRKFQKNKRELDLPKKMKKETRKTENLTKRTIQTKKYFPKMMLHQPTLKPWVTYQARFSHKYLHSIQKVINLKQIQAKTYQFTRGSS